MANIETVGTFACGCCCGGMQREFTDQNCSIGYMRCSNCECIQVRRGSATQMVLRIQVAGQLTLQYAEKAAELARLLGAPDNVVMVSENQTHYYDVSAQGAINNLEIAHLRESNRS